VVKPFPNVSLNFQEAYDVGDRLWALGRRLHDEPKYSKPPNWILTYRYAIRAMLARILTVDRDYRNLNTPSCGIAPLEEMPPRASNEWNVIWESYAGVLFFAMDSSLECFTHALNALGYLFSPSAFIDITIDEKLKRITPANLLDPPTKGMATFSAYGPCLKTFPQICAHWSANRELVAQIIEYHDATKHRHSVVVGQGLDYHLLKPEPKRTMSAIVFNEARPVEHARVPYAEEDTLQSITARYRTFIIEWLRIARQELEAVFGQPFSALGEQGAEEDGGEHVRFFVAHRFSGPRVARAG
jgi:hypothetical protein